MKEHKKVMFDTAVLAARAKLKEEGFIDLHEAYTQHDLSVRDLESAIMRQGMTLKYIGNPDPYPESKNPASPVVDPTADGLKL